MCGLRDTYGRIYADAPEFCKFPDLDITSSTAAAVRRSFHETGPWIGGAEQLLFGLRSRPDLGVAENDKDMSRYVNVSARSQMSAEKGLVHRAQVRVVSVGYMSSMCVTSCKGVILAGRPKNERDEDTTPMRTNRSYTCANACQASFRAQRNKILLFRQNCLVFK